MDFGAANVRVERRRAQPWSGTGRHGCCSTVGMLPLGRGVLASSLFVVLAACASSESTPPSSESEVVGGRARAPGEYRSVGALVGRAGLCTATLVTPQIVLTAAHCGAIQPLSFCVDGGAGNECAPTDFARSVPEPWLGVGRCPAGGDMSLIHLAKPITSVAPLGLVDVSAPLDSVCDVVGFGGSDDRHAEATVGQLRVVKTEGSGLNGVGVEGRTDVGDSGGPVVCDGKLAAVTSCGVPGSDAGWYVTTHAFLPWLRETIADWSRPRECTRFDRRCEHASGHDEMWSCDDLGHWRLLRACPAGNCYASSDQAGCPD